MTRLSDLRTQIDEVDDELLRLLCRRARLAVQVGEVKRAGGLPLYDPGREAAILKRASLGCARGETPGALDAAAVRRIFRRIIRETRRAERLALEAAESRSEVVS